MRNLQHRLARLEQHEGRAVRHITLKLAYDSYDVEPDWDSIPPFCGVTYVIAVPQKAPSAEAWRQAVQQRFAHEQPGDQR
jgi:hypothetical protein